MFQWNQMVQNEPNPNNRNMKTKPKLQKPTEWILTPINKSLVGRIDSIIHSGKLLSSPQRKGMRSNYIRLISYLFMEKEQPNMKSKLNAQGHSEYVEKTHEYLRDYLIGEDVREICANLESAQIIYIKGSYSNNAKLNYRKETYSKGYCLQPQWYDGEYFEPSQVPIFKKKKKKEKEKEKDSTQDYEKFLTIDAEKAIKCLDTAVSKTTGEKMSQASIKAQATRILNLNLTGFKENEGTTGRVFHVANQLKSETREFMKINGNSCAELDIKACNPSILYKFCSEEEKPRWKHLMIITGIYEHFTKECGFKNLSETKLAFVKMIGGGQDKNIKTLFAAIQKNFPSLAFWMLEQQNLEHGEIARCLQRIESTIVVKEMKKASFQTVSIHDGILVEKKHAQEAYRLLSKAFKKHVGTDCRITGLEETGQLPPSVGLN